MEDIVHIDPQMLVYVEREVKAKDDVLRAMAKRLCSAGYVKESYEEGIISREKIYPTGLYTGSINVAVPHTDCIHVYKDSVAVGILQHPVCFQAMDNPENSIKVSIVIMLALKEAHGQLQMLQKVLSLVKEQDELKRILKIKNEEDLYPILLNYLH